MKRKYTPLLALGVIVIFAVVLRQINARTKKAYAPSTIDSLIQQSSGSISSGDTSVDLDTGISGELQYEGGGEYAEYSQGAVSDALSARKRVIIVAERDGDPTSASLYDDVTARSSRIPKNTIIFFADYDSEGALRSAYSLTRPNSIIYLDESGNEKRRKGNGIVTLEQIVRGIDGLQGVQ